MNKQINGINGYSCVKVQFYDFLLFTRAERSEARVTCLRMHFIPPPTLKSCMKPCLVKDLAMRWHKRETRRAQPFLLKKGHVTKTESSKNWLF